jgi:nitroreductase
MAIDFSLTSYQRELRLETREAIDRLVRTRRSIRRFTDRPVSKKLLLEILDIAGRAPSNSNMQPWRVFMAGGAVKDKRSSAQ